MKKAAKTKSKPTAAGKKIHGKAVQMKLTLDEFRGRLKAKHYKDAAGARKAIARIKSEADRVKAEQSVVRSFGA